MPLQGPGQATAQGWRGLKLEHPDGGPSGKLAFGKLWFTPSTPQPPAQPENGGVPSAPFVGAPERGEPGVQLVRGGVPGLTVDTPLEWIPCTRGPALWLT